MRRFGDEPIGHQDWHPFPTDAKYEAEWWRIDPDGYKQKEALQTELNAIHNAQTPEECRDAVLAFQRAYRQRYNPEGGEPDPAFASMLAYLFYSLRG